jgi:hypothetical protein
VNAAGWVVEQRLIGWKSLGFTLLTAGAVTVAALLASVFRAQSAITTLLTGGLEVGLPLAAAAVTAWLVGDDPARELQLSWPVSYRTTLMRRAGLATAWPAATALVWSIGLIATNHWIAPGGMPSGELSWVATLLWMNAVACMLTVAVRSQVAAVATLATLTVAEAILFDLFLRNYWLHYVYLFATTRVPAHSFWWSNRLALLGTAAVVAIATWALLSKPERLLMEDDR